MARHRKGNVRKAALAWCGRDDAKQERPHLTKMVKQLAEEHHIYELAVMVAIRDIRDGNPQTALLELEQVYRNLTGKEP